MGLWSRGIPRLVNAICDNALLLACGDGVKVIGVAHIDEVARDFQLRGDAPPSARLVPAKPEPRTAQAAAALAPAYAAVAVAEAHEENRSPDWKLGALPILERYAMEQSRSLLGRWAARFGF